VTAIAWALSGAVAVAGPKPTGTSDVSAAARQQLISILQSPTAANASSYQTRDDTGFTVDTIKMISSPTGGYLGVYHVNDNWTFHVRLASSSDLIHWTYRTTLEQYGNTPTIGQLADGSFLVIYEKDEPGGTSHLRFVDYANLAALLVNVPVKTFDAPLTLSSTHEGTPNIRSATLSPGLANSQIQIGFHYNDATVSGDREALGTLTNFSSWSARTNRSLNRAFSPTPADIGDRDFLNFQGYPFTVVEARSIAGDWGSWRVYVYDETAKTLTQLAIHTAGGSQSFANPATTVLTDPAGHRALATSYYIHSAGSAPGEAGPLVFYTEY
jgi:hypothetical protein